MVLYTGQIKIKTANDKSFEGTLYINKGNFNYEIKDLLLPARQCHVSNLGCRESRGASRSMSRPNSRGAIIGE